MSNLRIVPPLVRIWSPEDAAALRALAEEMPAEVGGSTVLADIVDHAR